MTRTTRTETGRALWRAGAERLLLVITVAALAAGAGLRLAGAPGAADLSWAAGTVAAIVPTAFWILYALLHGRAGVDLVALLSLVGTLVVGEFAAGALVAVMVATGRTLEAAASRRASRDLRALVERVPRTAHLRDASGVRTVPLDDVAAGNRLVVGPGEVVPVDGTVAGATAVLDESALTGESLLVERAPGTGVRSGAVNGGPAFELRAEATARESTYAEIVRLARQAGAESAPVVRLADRYAAWFVPVSLAVALVAFLLSGSPVRAVAVLVVATPCPLLLAAPAAIVSGLSQAARQGVVVRDGGALENLGRVRTMVLDKTGTLTGGSPRVVDIAAAPDVRPDDVLRLAAALDQMSPHVLARAMVREARARGLRLPVPGEVTEEPGAGVRAVLDGRRLTVGRRPAGSGLPPWARAVENRAVLDGSATAWLTSDGELLGAVLLQDPLRPDAPRTLRRLRSAGLRRLIMLTGDRAEPAREIAAVLGLDAVRAEQTPADKVAAVRAERERAVTVMVGDGVNDAPALATADIGVAMGGHGSTASSEAADVVLTTDRVERVADAIDIAARSRRIAVQSALGGMVMSLAAMAAAAAGLLPPAPGALLQEAIDVAVILNALRALRVRRPPSARLDPDTRDLITRLAAEHDDLRTVLDTVRDAADKLSAGAEALPAVRRAYTLLTERLLPHERAEEDQLYPALATPLGGPEAIAPMSRAHTEIERLTRRIGNHLELVGEQGRLLPEQIDDLRSCLYGLSAVLRLHFAQEEESYFSLA
ncbi:heavy metal translocating P-type ATPase [Streptomyces meridianus]|uniref:Heavy metal translocating P-type ATPase n=1 Tax=Streptomyces meridianus TaxID=2938945 RepID=A0ABT0X4G4_9ACTN|nr:heavy metal translocating P-type ATPase [Streptomyces meridianus]MCM2577423.1 heavy metal translocating P-type ATPase [Streptomyces meridianus]